MPVRYHLVHILVLYAVISLHIHKDWEELLKKVQLLKNLEGLGISKDVVQKATFTGCNYNFAVLFI